MKKRILKYLKETPQAKSIVVSDLLRNRVVLSYNGNKLVWEWVGGLKCPDGAVVDIHPLAAEALVVEEIMNFFRMEGIDTSTVAYINHIGHVIDGVIVNIADDDEESPFDIVLKKEKIKDLYERFVFAKDCLTEEMIGEAISFGVLTPFLSLVNL